MLERERIELIIDTLGSQREQQPTSVKEHKPIKFTE